VSSACKNLLNLYFSVAAPGLVSAEKIGLHGNLLKPQWNSMSCFEGTTSLFSIVRIILNDMVETLASLGKRVDKISALPRANDYKSSDVISRTIFR